MPHRVIPIQSKRLARPPATPRQVPAQPGALRDTLGRTIRDLRISVTDRCNFRCTYCMPREAFGPDHAFLPQGELLSFEEIERLARAFVELGVRKIRLTGGEPLLRRELHRLIAALAPLGADLALTTNGSLLARQAPALKAAGLNRVTVSLDALDDGIFRAMNDADFPVARVLEAIEAAAAAGLAPIKINMVVKRGVNDSQILPMAEHFRGSGHVLRFIEYMDVGSSNGWRMDDVVPAAEIISRIAAKHPLEPRDAGYRGEVAKRWRYADGGGEIGVIASVTQAFCGDCNRIRLSTEGALFTCLFAESGHDLKRLLREGGDDRSLRNAIQAVWLERSDRYSELRSANTAPLAGASKVEMSYIGG